MRIDFEYISNLQYEVKALRAQVKAYESGEAYRSQQESYEKKLREKDRRIRFLLKELEVSHRETVTVRNNWMQVFEDMEKEQEKVLSRAQKKEERLKKRALEAEAQRDQWHDKWSRQQESLYAVQTELEEEKEKNRKLTAQINRDFENSSIPSSKQGPGRKKIPNSRIRTGRRPGGQPGHEGHRRKKHVPLIMQSFT